MRSFETDVLSMLQSIKADIEELKGGGNDLIGYKAMAAHTGICVTYLKKLSTVENAILTRVKVGKLTKFSKVEFDCIRANPKKWAKLNAILLNAAGKREQQYNSHPISS